jgi:hypothetical protein
MVRVRREQSHIVGPRNTSATRRPLGARSLQRSRNVGSRRQRAPLGPARTGLRRTTRARNARRPTGRERRSLCRAGDANARGE